MPGVISHLSNQRGIPLTDVGRSNALFGAVYAVSAPTLGWLLRRLDPVRVLVCALPGLGLTMVGLALAHDTAGLFAMRGLQAALASVVVPFSVVHAGSIVARAQRSRALSIAYSGLVVASLIGAPLGEALAGRLGVGVVFLVGAVLAVLSCIGLLCVRGFQRALTRRAEPSAATGAHGRVTGSVVVIGAVFGAAFTEAVGTVGLSSYLTPFLEDRLGAAGPALSVLLVCYGVGGLAGNSVAGLVTDRVGPARVIAVTHVLAAAAVAALLVVRDPVATGMLLGLWGFASWAINPALQALILAHGGRSVNVLVGVNSSVIYAGASVGAAVASAAVDTSGVEAVPALAAAAFTATVVSGVVAGVVVRRS
jgi:predicted MFS family arabinose efflux permease